MTIKSLQSTSLTNNIFYRSMLAGNVAFGLPSYWLTTLGGTSNEDAKSVAIDSAGNAYVLGGSYGVGAGDYDFLLAKYNSDGTIQWQRVLGGTGSDEGKSVAIDSSDNVYVFGYTNSTGEGVNDFLLAKYNSSGTIQWQRILGGAGNDNGESVAIDSSDNVYVLGRSYSVGAGSADLFFAKYNSSGAIQWQRTLGTNLAEEGFSVAIDSANNVYLAGWTQSTGAGGNDLLLAKYNSDGTIQWQRVLGGTSNEFSYSLAFDSSDNVYVGGATRSEGVGNYSCLLAKYNSAGTVQWQKILYGADNDQYRGIAVDSNDNIYASGITSSTTGGDFDYISAKYDASGALQYQRTLGGSGNSFSDAIAINSSDSIYLFGKTESTGAGFADFLLAKLPNDGSLTGTYVLDGVNIVYAASSLTAATSTLTAATSSLTSATSGATDSTASLTSASVSLTSHFVEIGA